MTRREQFLVAFTAIAIIDLVLAILAVGFFIASDFWRGAGALVVAGALLFLPFLVSAEDMEIRKQRGLCVSCGYNLTGNVSGTCPECGKPVASPAVAPSIEL